MRNKKSLIITISVLSVAILCILGVLHTKNNFNNYITKINSYIEKDDFAQYKPICSFDGEDNNIINITFEPLFDNCDYDAQKDIIIGLTKEINKLYTEYHSSQLLKKYVNCSVNILADNNIFHCEISNENEYTIFKNKKPYNELDNLHERLTTKISEDDKFLKYIYGISDIEILKKILNVKDIEECKKEILYTTAKIYIENNNHSAKDILILLKDYKDSKNLLNYWNYNHEYDGTWYGTNGFISDFKIAHKWIINGNKCYSIYTENNTKNGINEYSCVRNNDTLYVFKSTNDIDDFSKADFVFEYSNEQITYEFWKNITFVIHLEKISDDIELPKTSYIPDPTIGMTSAEVKNSTWGSPKKINKNAYSWGVREQWVYGDGRYIYLEDGIVTSISTSE